MAIEFRYDESLKQFGVDFTTKRLENEDGKAVFLIKLKQTANSNSKIDNNGNQFYYNFYIHFRKKGHSQWQSSPLIIQSNSIEINGLDLDSRYQIRIVILTLSQTKEVTTEGDVIKAIVHRDSLTLVKRGSTSSQMQMYDHYYESDSSKDKLHKAANLIGDQLSQDILSETFTYLKYYKFNYFSQLFKKEP